MTKGEILAEIRRTAAANGGVPLGRMKFESETGIAESDWLGKIWARWGDAVREAGFVPNELKQAYTQDELLERFANLTLELGHVPTVPEIRLRVRGGSAFPEGRTFARAFGSKQRLVAKLLEYCSRRPEYATVVGICEKYLPHDRQHSAEPDSATQQMGFVYLMKSAKFYKIGKASVTDRRHRELAIQMPERLMLVHQIKTDDPFGIEAYWHNRFAEKRRNGEWFELNAADVAAFRRRKFM